MKRFTAALTLVLILALLAVPAQAKAPRNGKYIDASGNIFIMKNGRPRTGHFRYKGKWYYGHKTNDGPYVKGSCTAGEMRVERGNKWYAYGLDGAMIRKDQYVHRGRRRILQLDIRSRNHTVRYVYGTARGEPWTTISGSDTARSAAWPTDRTGRMMGDSARHASVWNSSGRRRRSNGSLK